MTLRRQSVLVALALVALATGATASGLSTAGSKAPGALVAVSARTGQLAAFPRIPAGDVYAVTDDGSGGWYVGGDFAAIGGVRCANLAHIGADLKVDRGWCPRPDGTVRALLRIGSTLYLGGEFLRHVAGVSRSGLAAFDTTTGRITKWGPRISGHDGAVYDLAADASGRTIYLRGSFARIDGVFRDHLAAVSAVSGRPTAFAPNPDEDFHGNSVVAFAVGPQAVYVWGYITKIGGAPTKTGVAAVDRRTGRALPWRFASDGGPYEAVVADGTVYIGGVFSRIDLARRDDLAAFDAVTGKLQPWSPRTGADHVGALAPMEGGIVTVLEPDHFRPVVHRIAAFDRETGAQIWRSPVRVGGYVFVVAASPKLVVVGGRVD